MSAIKLKKLQNILAVKPFLGCRNLAASAALQQSKCFYIILQSHDLHSMPGNSIYEGLKWNKFSFMDTNKAILILLIFITFYYNN